MEQITAEAARRIRQQSVADKKKKELEEAQGIPFFVELTEKVKDAALDGESHVQIGPHEAEYYQEVIDSGKIVPGEEKQLPLDWKKVFKVFEESLGYKVSITQYPAQFLRSNGIDMITVNIETATLYW